MLFHRSIHRLRLSFTHAAVLCGSACSCACRRWREQASARYDYQARMAALRDQTGSLK